MSNNQEDLQPEELQFDGDLFSPASFATTDPSTELSNIRSPSVHQLRSTVDWEELPVTYDLGNISISRSNLATPQPAHKAVKWERPPENSSMESLDFDNGSQKPQHTTSTSSAAARQARSPTPVAIGLADPVSPTKNRSQSVAESVSAADLDMLNQKNLDLVHRLHSAHQLLSHSDRLVRQSQEEIQTLRDELKRCQAELVQSNQQRLELLEENDQMRGRLQFLEDRVRLGEQDLRLARLDSLKVEALENELAVFKQSREKLSAERNDYYAKWQEYMHRNENLETENKLLTSQCLRFKESNGQIEEYKDDLQKAMQEMQVRDRMIREKVALIRKLECDRDHADALETEELRSRVRHLEDEQFRHTIDRSPSPSNRETLSPERVKSAPISSPRKSAMGSPQHPQHQQSPTRPRTAGPFFSGGADIADIIQQTDDLQDRLAELASEKEQLEAEYTRFPLAGGSLSMRKRKEMVETRLDTVSREISAVKLQLKALHAL